MIRLFAGVPLAGALVEPINGRQVTFVGDLPATPDHGRSISWSLAAFATLALATVLLTVRPYLAPGLGTGEVTALSIGYGLATLGTLLVPWSRLGSAWTLALLAPPIVFTASLSAMTGSGSSPYVALYAPLLAICGWHLSLRYTLAAAALVVSTELWRVWVIDGTGSVAQLAVALPFAVGLAVVASLAASHLRIALTEIRRDQVQLDSALRTLRELESTTLPDLLGELRLALAEVFEAAVVAIEFDAARPRDREIAAQGDASGIVSVMVGGRSRLFGMMRLAPRRALSRQELRLATLMADTVGRIAESRLAAGSDAVGGTNG